MIIQVFSDQILSKFDSSPCNNISGWFLTQFQSFQPSPLFFSLLLKHSNVSFTTTGYVFRDLRNDQLHTASVRVNYHLLSLQWSGHRLLIIYLFKSKQWLFIWRDNVVIWSCIRNVCVCVFYWLMVTLSPSPSMMLLGVRSLWTILFSLCKYLKARHICGAQISTY